MQQPQLWKVACHDAFLLSHPDQSTLVKLAKDLYRQVIGVTSPLAGKNGVHAQVKKSPRTAGKNGVHAQVKKSPRAGKNGVYAQVKK
jgi:hypothetical protein